jgi:alpha-beta hydrolase superfamily lysophospholipase
VREPGEAAWYGRRWRWLVTGGIALLVALAVGVAVAWHFSDAVLVPDHSSWAKQAEVVALPPGRIVLDRNDESERPGTYGLEWPGGHAIAGSIVGEGEDTVTRKLRAVRGYLVSEMDVGIESDVHVGDPRQALGLPSQDIDVPDELGPMPGWLVPAGGRTWAIVVHGINGTPQIGLRLVPTLHRAGLPTMLISYREDQGAPASPDGLHHMGLTEWHDLQAAARYALAHGAKRLILAGYSMGGAVVAQFMQRSVLAKRVAGLILDAPVLDWRRTLEFNATQMGLPGFSVMPVEWVIGARIDTDWSSLDALRHPEDFHLPILLFHGEDDEVVPISTSEDLAAELPRWVTYHRAPEAGHTQSWNVDPRLYERRLSDFLDSLRGFSAQAGRHPADAGDEPAGHPSSTSSNH